MAVCLDYQSVIPRRAEVAVSYRMHICAAVALLLALSVRIWVKLEITDLGYNLAQAQQQAVRLDMERRELELQRAILFRPAALALAAQTRLGLLPLNPAQAIKVSKR